MISAPIILNIPHSQASFRDGKSQMLRSTPDTYPSLSVSKQFKDQWKHPTPVPKVVQVSLPTPRPPLVLVLIASAQVWKIYCDRGHTDEFSRYKLAIERKTNLSGGNSKRRWHGTVRACTVGDSETQSALCVDPACSLCNIIRVRPLSPRMRQLWL